MNRNIIVVEATSTGKFFVSDIRNLGFEPIVLEQKNPDWLLEHSRKSAYKYFKDNFPTIIRECDNYQDTLSKVKMLNPLLIVPGNEYGVELANKLAYNLNLPANPPNTVVKTTNKDIMQKSLKDAGLRYIKGGVVDSIDDCYKFLEDNINGVYLKPVRGAGSVNNSYCQTKEQIKFAWDIINNEKDFFKDYNNQAIIQEYIGGDEYIVNTVVNDGRSKVVSAWKYHKVQVIGGGNLYDYMISIMESDFDDKITELFNYAIQVNKALDIKYGAVHGEFKIDKNGPVLIETNCRPQGSGRPPAFTERIFSHHETDMILNAYLYPEKIDFDNKLFYKSKEYGLVKYIICDKKRVIMHAPIATLSRSLDSFVDMLGDEIDGKITIEKTDNLVNSPATIFLANQKKQQLIKDYQFIRDIEQNNFEKLYN